MDRKTTNASDRERDFWYQLLNYLKEVKVILERSGKYPTKVKIGRNYHEMEDITEKFV